MTRPRAVRAIVTPRAEPPYDRLLDPLVEQVIAGSEVARARIATLWTDEAGLRRLGGKLAPLPASLAEELEAYHRRLGGSASSLRALARLASGEAVCAIAGQQPAPLVGPLFALHKTAAAVGLARRYQARTGVPCVAVFWNHTEDSDFEEIRTVTVGDATLALHDLSLSEAEHREGGLIGSLDPAGARKVADAALELWSALPGRPALTDLLRSAGSRGRDLGEVQAALLLALFGEQGLVVVDPRLPAFRAAARPVVDRYLARAEELGAAARAAGQTLESALGRRPLADAALESFVFALRDGARHKLSVAEARALGADSALVPSVALRPVVQDGVLPTVAMACGPGELAYLAQLREVFEALEVRAAAPVPRLSATWLPKAALELIEASGAEPWRVVAATDQVVRTLAESRVPAALREGLERLRADLTARLKAFADEAARLDPSLPQMVESARGKMDYQLGRLEEGLVGKVRHAQERERPEWLRLRYYLQPGDKLQERRLASLEPVAYGGPSVVQDLCDLAEHHAEALERGEHPHYLLEL